MISKSGEMQMINYNLSNKKMKKSENCILGYNDHLYQRLKTSITKANKIDIIVAFVMESGVRILQENLKQAVERGIRIRLLCGNYLNITEPQALYLLKDTLQGSVDLRFYNVPGKSFHPKAYIFEHLDYSEVYIGSSNISRSALTDGIEWNYRIDSRKNSKDYNCFKNEFENLFLNHSLVIDDKELKNYSKNWKKPKVFDDLERIPNQSVFNEKVADTPSTYHITRSNETQNIEDKENILPIGPQIEALYELKKTRLEGWDRGIVVAATGIGKTFLAAFDSKDFKKILFIAHREEILKQAEGTFKAVMPNVSTGFFDGVSKDNAASAVFATVQTLGRAKYLSDIYFKKDNFEYIVIDEFHHASADTYKRIIEFFKPKFLLGLTATPERLDNQDVFSLCDYNLVYEVRLKEAVNKGWLVPFRYYGIYDETNFDRLDYKKGKYDEKQLEDLLSIHTRGTLIFEHYSKYNSKRALGFCSGRNHAIFMAEFFNNKNIKACAVISGQVPEDKKAVVLDRKDALDKLKTREIKVIFSVDIFNEGLDIPAIDMVMFLRPTESPVVFLQQLGRGLRRYYGKKYLNVLDFIGNYKKANLIPFLLSGEIREMEKRVAESNFPEENEYPDECIINFDLKIVDLFKKMTEARKGIIDTVRDEYFRIKDLIGMKPLRLELYTYMNEELLHNIRKSNETNIFKDYLSFLNSINELSEGEEEIRGTFAHEFLKMVENTGMTRTYKMPLLKCFYNNGNIRLEITKEDIYHSFKKFYSVGSHAVDLLRDKHSKDYKNWGMKEFLIKAKNPIEAFRKTEKRYFSGDENLFKLDKKLESFIENSEFKTHLEDVIDYRTKRFFKEKLKKIERDND